MKDVVVPFLKLNLCIVHNSWRIPDQDILPYVTQLKLPSEWNRECWSLAQRKTSVRHESGKSSQDRLAVSPRHMMVLNGIGCLNLLKFLKNIRQAGHSSHSVIWEPWSAERTNYRETKQNWQFSTKCSFILTLKHTIVKAFQHTKLVSCTKDRLLTILSSQLEVVYNLN